MSFSINFNLKFIFEFLWVWVYLQDIDGFLRKIGQQKFIVFSANIIFSSDLCVLLISFFVFFEQKLLFIDPVEEQNPTLFALQYLLVSN